MLKRTRGYAVLATVVCLTLSSSAQLQAQNDPSNAAYPAVPNHGDTKSHVPLVQKNASGWYTTIAVQNLSETNQANVGVSFYSNSATADHVVNLQIPAGAPSVVSTSSLAALPGGYLGSAVVSSDKEVAVAFVQSDETSTAASRGTNQGSSTTFLTQAFYDGGSGIGRATRFVIQNTGIQSATVNVSCTDGHVSNFMVGVNQSVIRDEEGQTHFEPNFNCTVTSDQPIADLQEIRDLDFPDVFIIEGLPATGGTCVAPATMLQSQGRSTTSILTNVGNAMANAGWQYEDAAGSGTTLDPLESVLALDATLPIGYRGGMLADGDQPLFVYVDMRDTSTDGDQTAGYAARCTPDQGGELFTPLALKNAGGVARGRIGSSYFNIFNVGAGPTEITVTFTDANGSTSSPQSKTPDPHSLAPFMLGADESIEIDLSSLSHAELPDGLYAAKIESDGQPLAAVVLLNFAAASIFTDGFESGDTSSWSSTVQ
jgi:hypothetical protein